MRNYNTDRWAMRCPECGYKRGTCISEKTVKGGIIRTYECMFCGSEFDVLYPEIIHEPIVADISLEVRNG